MKAKSVRKVASWPTPGVIYASQTRTIDGKRYLIGQGGTTALPWGDPLSLWEAEGDETFKPVNIPGRPHNGTNIIVQTDSPFIFPHMSYDNLIAEHPETQCGSTAMGTWYPREDGLFEMWFVPAFGNPSNVGGAYEQEFTLYRLQSQDLRTWWRIDYNHDVKNLALRNAALRMTDVVTPLPLGQTGYPFAHGIGGCAAIRTFLLSEKAPVLYLMLKCFYEAPVGSGKGAQKNVLVRSFDDGKTFEAWMTGPATNWKPCTNGLIPPELFTHGYAPHAWPIDSMYETPPSLASLPGAKRFVALVGQPEKPQLALTFSDDLMGWGKEIEIELPAPPRTAVSAALRAQAMMASTAAKQMPLTRDAILRRFQRSVRAEQSLRAAGVPVGWSGINYRTMDPDSGKMYFGSDAEGDMLTYGVKLEAAVGGVKAKGKKRAVGK